MSSNAPTFSPVDPAALKDLGRLDACSVANAIEAFGVRLRNSGFADATVRCQFEDLPPLVGYAATVRVRTSEPPMEGESYYYRLDWLDHLMKIPAPRVLIVEDMDPHPGVGSFIGEVHANILVALGCVGVVTNGAVRDIPGARALKFQMFAGAVSPSHAFAHVVDYGNVVHVGGMPVKPGDLLHGDRHGVQTVPLEIAPKVPAVAQRMNAEEAALIEFCRSNAFSLEKLRSEVEALRTRRKNLRGPNS
jgi:4-hydroxy-4-methyl-2-oxoglutarate aldolase